MPHHSTYNRFMRSMKGFLRMTGVVGSILVSWGTAAAQSEMGNIPINWQTTAEKTGYQKTSTYDEAVAYSKKLAAASGGLITYTTYGKSGEGRDLPLLIAAKDGAS